MHFHMSYYLRILLYQLLSRAHFYRSLLPSALITEPLSDTGFLPNPCASGTCLIKWWWGSKCEGAPHGLKLRLQGCPSPLCIPVAEQTSGNNKLHEQQLWAQAGCVMDISLQQGKNRGLGRNHTNLALRKQCEVHLPHGLDCHPPPNPYLLHRCCPRSPTSLPCPGF